MIQVKNRRRRLIIDPELQKRIVFAGAWPPCLAMAAAILLLGFLSSRLGREALEAGVELPSLLWLFLATAVLLVLAMGFVIWTSLRISHRVAGPSHNIDQVLQRTRTGDLNARVRLREGDFLVAVAASVNAHLEWLQAHPPGDSEPIEDAEPAAEVVATADALQGVESGLD